METQLGAFLTWAPDGGEWSASHNRERALYPMERKTGGTQSVCTVLR